MKFSYVKAVAAACLSLAVFAADASVDLGVLPDGASSVQGALTHTTQLGGVDWRFDEPYLFTLTQASNVAGTFVPTDARALLAGVSISRADVAYPAVVGFPVPHHDVSPIPTSDGFSFDLGTLSAGTYNLHYIGSIVNASTGHFNATLTVTSVPEPATWAVMALGLAGVAAVSRRRTHA